MDYPLVSCIMPTKNRRKFVAQSLQYFEEQDYPNKELIVVDDGDDLVVDLVSRHPDVYYLAPQYAHTVGMKRNIACEAAHGEIICHWDDDDWYSSSRLSYQIAPLIAGIADITALHLQFVLDLEHMQAWQCTDAPEPKSGVDGMHYGTVVYRKHLWRELARFQDSPKGDDGSGFVRKLVGFGANAYTLPCASHQVYVRHGRNIWKYRPGASIGSEVWHRTTPESCIQQKDRDFYKIMSAHVHQEKHSASSLANFQKRLTGIVKKRVFPSIVPAKQ